MQELWLPTSQGVTIKKAAIYTRVSSQEQVDGYSLSAQREICETFAKNRGWKITSRSTRNQGGRANQRIDPFSSA
jgi:DNA invertase Pin-like site-specific DNA recombinase